MITDLRAAHGDAAQRAARRDLGGETGSIEAGKCADLIACRENPLEGFTALRELELVVRGGARIERPQIKKMPDVERELDKCL